MRHRDIAPVPTDALRQIKEAVTRGVEVMDAYWTDWYLVPDLDRLQMKSATCCILGQKAATHQSDAVLDGYVAEVNDLIAWMCETMNFPNPLQECADTPDTVDTEWFTTYYGFDLPVYAYSKEGEILWGALDREWRVAILVRRDRAEARRKMADRAKAMV